MKRVKQVIQNHFLAVVSMLAVLTVLASGVFIYASMQGQPRQLFQFTGTVPDTLGTDQDVAGWASFDQDSYLPGETIRYTVRILYRGGKVVPDLDQFRRSLSFLPVERRTSFDKHQALADGVDEYTLDYVLQAVNVDPRKRYDLEPAVLFYKAVDAGERELQSIRISTPPIFITEYYPQNVARIPLRPLKPQIDDSSLTRQLLIGVSGSILLVLGMFLLWHYGRVRKLNELSETERLWQKFDRIQPSSPDYRASLLKSEEIVLGLLAARANLSPTDFWRGHCPEAGVWRDFTLEMRQDLGRVYQQDELGEQDVTQVTNRLKAVFSQLVAEDVMKREQDPSFLQRLADQPRVIATSGVCLLLALVVFVLTAMPGLWISPVLLEYNNAIISLSAAKPLVEESKAFLELGEYAEDSVIKSAAFYNAGTIKSYLKFSNDPPMEEEELMDVVFQDEPALDQYLDNDASVEMFFSSAGWLREGKDHLRDAIRANPGDEDILRNLELVSKRHNAVLTAIKYLYDSQNIGALQVKSKLETMVDVLNQEWPEEVVEKEQDEPRSSTYKVWELF